MPTSYFRGDRSQSQSEYFIYATATHIFCLLYNYKVIKSQNSHYCNIPSPSTMPQQYPLSSPAASYQIQYKWPPPCSLRLDLDKKQCTYLNTVYNFLVDEIVFWQTVKIYTMVLFDLTDLKVKCSLSHKQNTVLPVVKSCQPTLHLVFGGMLANILELHYEQYTEALTFSKNDFNLTYSK